MKTLFENSSPAEIVDYLNNNFSPLSFCEGAFIPPVKVKDEKSLEIAFLSEILNKGLIIKEYSYSFYPDLFIDDSCVKKETHYSSDSKSQRKILENNVLQKVISNPKYDAKKHKIILKRNDLIRVDGLNATIMFGKYDVVRMVSTIKQYYFESNSILFFPYTEYDVLNKTDSCFYEINMSSEAFNRLQLSYIEKSRVATEAIYIGIK